MEGGYNNQGYNQGYNNQGYNGYPRMSDDNPDNVMGDVYNRSSQPLNTTQPPYNPSAPPQSSYSTRNGKSCSKQMKIGLIVTAIIIVLVVSITVGVVVGGSNSSSNSSGSVTITIQSSNTKEAWLDEIVELFKDDGLKTTSGKKIKIDLHHTGSTLKADLEPTIWSPANSQFIRIQGTQDNIVYVSDEDSLCYPVTDIPVGLAMWRQMATVLGWPDTPISFKDIGELALHSDGWGSINPLYSSWGHFRYGHGHPDSSNSGRLSFVATMAAFGPNGTSTLDSIDTAATDEDVIAITQSVQHLGKIDTDLLARMRDHGPTYLHAVANYESNVIYWNEIYSSNLTKWGDDWVFIYLSDGTFWMSHPLCVLDGADWNNEDQIEAARIFAEYATLTENLELLLQYGIRPAESAGVSDITCCGSTITEANGADPTQNLESISLLTYPTDEIMSYVLDVWHTIKKPAAFALVIDTSGSMSTNGRLVVAKQAVINFLNSTDNQDWLYLTGFNGIFPKQGNKTTVYDDAVTWVSTLQANGGTPIYSTMIQAWNYLNDLKIENEKNGTEWNYAIVSMTDGAATDPSSTYNQFFNSPINYVTSAELSTNSDIIHIFPIIFGDDAQAEEDNFNTLAEVSGGKFFSANNADISDIYYQLSLEL